MYVRTSHMCRTHGGQNGAVDPLGLELQRAVSHLWVLGTEPGPSSTVARALN